MILESFIGISIGVAIIMVMTKASETKTKKSDTSITEGTNLPAHCIIHLPEHGGYVVTYRKSVWEDAKYLRTYCEDGWNIRIGLTDDIQKAFRSKDMDRVISLVKKHRELLNGGKIERHIPIDEEL